MIRRGLKAAMIAILRRDIARQYLLGPAHKPGKDAPPAPREVILSACRLDALKCDGMSDGMPTMTHRTTFALDDTTAQRLKRLAARWQVSQAEVVRRSVEQAEKQTAIEKPDPIAMLRRLHEAGGGIDPVRAEKWIAEIREDRKRWRAS